MKRLKQFTLTFSLTLVLTVSVIAGEIQTGVVNPPPPPTQSSLAEETEPTSIPGNIHTGVLSNDLSIELLNLLLSVY
jgi:hypothetical protein